MKNRRSFLLTMYLAVFSFAGLGQEVDSLFHFDAATNNISIGYDFKQFRKLKSANSFGPFHLKYERTISQNVGIGASSYIFAENSTTENDQIIFPNGDILQSETHHFGFAILPKINWHFDMTKFKNVKIRKWDIYAGIGIGYGFEIKKTDYLMTYLPPEGTVNLVEDKREVHHYVATEFNLGARYFPTKHFGAYIEFGYGVSHSQIGIIYKW